jgi:quercetin dioxygenase-like cupin family protein
MAQTPCVSRTDGQHPISRREAQRDRLSRRTLSAYKIEEDFMSLLNRRELGLLSFAAVALSRGSACAVELNPAAVAYELPDQIKWSPPSPAGAQNAVLAGDPSKEGLYVQMVKWLAGNHFSHPHFHPHDRFITVLKGTWWVGTGTKYDPSATVPMPAGTFVTHFGKQVHFDGAKDEDAVLLIVGEGPGTSTPAEVK